MEPPPAYHRAANGHERLMDVGAFVETRPQSAELMEQCQRLFHNVTKDAQAAAVRRSPPRDGRADITTRQLHSVGIGVVTPIRHHFLRLAQRRAWLAGDGWDRIDQRNQLRHVVAVGSSENGGKRHAARINNDVVFRPVFPAIHGAGSRFFPPCTARTDDESTITCDKSIRSSARNWFNSRRWSCSQTPASRHSSRRFHRVIPQQPISCGKYSQGMPVLSTKMIPVRQIRSGTRGLPTPGTYGCLGRIGSTRFQSSSDTNSLLIVSSLTAMRPILTRSFRRDKGHF